MIRENTVRYGIVILQPKKDNQTKTYE